MANEVANLRKRGEVVPVEENSVQLAILEFQSPTAALIAEPIPVASRMTIWIIGAMFATALGVAAVMPVNRVVSASGTLVSQASNIVIQPFETSIVRKIYVSEGQTVKKGDLLAELDPTMAGADASDYGAQVESMQAAVDRMSAEEAGKPFQAPDNASGQVQAAIYASRQSELDYKLENYKQKIASLQVAVQRAMADTQAYSGRLEVAKSVEAKRRELEKLQVGSQLNTLSALDQRLDIERNLQESRNLVASSTSDLQAMIRERDGFLQQWKADLDQQLSDEGRKLSDAKENLKKAALRRKLVDIYADQDAIVLSIAKVSIGSVMQSGDQFMKLVPMDAPLEAEVMIAGGESGFVHVGDPAAVTFDTFPQWQYGDAKGTVRIVSADSFQNPQEDPNKLMRPQDRQGETGLGMVYYRARVSIDELRLHDIPSSFRLQPGMSLTTDIEVGKRTVLGYLLGRVIPHFGESFREP